MREEHIMVDLIAAAQRDVHKADEFIKQYMPFIKAQTAKFMKKAPVEGQDDELSISMFAFYEALMAYKKEKGTFLSLAATTIQHRLIDFYRKEKRHRHIVSLDTPVTEGDDSKTLLDQVESKDEPLEEYHNRVAAKEEIEEFSRKLEEFHITLSDVAENCPRQERTFMACKKLLSYAKTHPVILDQLVAGKKIPVKQLAEGTGVSKKVMERHRDYIVAILLAYTNGYEIIRGHLYHVRGKEES